MKNIPAHENFINRHIGSSTEETNEMLKVIGVSSIDELIDKTIPQQIRNNKELELPAPMSEHKYINYIRTLAMENKIAKSYIGLGYYPSITPPVIQRNILENPGWYTQYTPYQAEISQGRLEALLNFQTMIIDLTGLPVANASLLDEGTAAAEAMSMVHTYLLPKKKGNKFFIDNNVFPQTIDVCNTRAIPQGIEIINGDIEKSPIGDDVFGVLVQYPCANGDVKDYRELFKSLKAEGVAIIVAADILSLALLTPPGEFGADVLVGSTQRFGIPMGFGGPHAAYMAVKDEYKRIIPGRIIGVSVDTNGNPALRMALQTREQHIRREKATSNICTAQVLLAIMAAMYAVYHGPKGIKSIAERIHALTCVLNYGLKKFGYTQLNNHFFDTLSVSILDKTKRDKIKEISESQLINLWYDKNSINISLNELTELNDVFVLLSIFANVSGKELHIKEFEQIVEEAGCSLPEELMRESSYLTHPVFNSYHSEHEMLRYLKRLENKDLSLTTSMIPLGSCTMKLNAASEMFAITLPELGCIHPFAPEDQVKGYKKIISELEEALKEITGFEGVSFMPNSGAQGEYAGLMTIRQYHLNKGDVKRNVVLIPASAHGTNPASAVMAGMQVVVVNCDTNGNIDVNDLKLKLEKHKENISALMVTYPSTHGVFEEEIIEICKLVHEAGGQVYMDGANMNAQVGLTSPALIGADVCHLNLHKTFAIPHGGGGPGMGPICVASHLIPFLPKHTIINVGGEKGFTAVSSAPYGSANVIVISLGYIKMLGAEGLKEATKYAILNANYIKARLSEYYKILYTGKYGNVAHEMIIDMREFKNSAHIEVEDVAKRLMDYGFHAPTVSFPVAGTLMVEPTESESKFELDRFCDAMISIHSEIDEIVKGISDQQDNVLKNAPHTMQETVSDNWTHKYSREKAAFPNDWVKKNKFWPSVARVNNAYGDRNLVCACPPVSSYEE